MMLKSIVLIFAFIFVAKISAQKAETGVASIDVLSDSVLIPDDILPWNWWKCGSWGKAWFFSCLTTTGKQVDICPRKVKFADCSAQPYCTWKSCLATDISPIEKERLPNPIPIGWIVKKKCVANSLTTFDAVIAGTTNLVKCIIPASCTCKCTYVSHWEHIPYALEEPRIED